MSSRAGWLPACFPALSVSCARSSSRAQNGCLLCCIAGGMRRSGLAAISRGLRPARHRVAEARVPGWLRGDRGHCSMARVPTMAEEDAKKPNRERECLVGERTRIVNRIKATLARMGIRNFKSTLRKAAERLATVHTPEGMPLSPNVLAELQRDMARLGFVVSQIREIEQARQKRLEQETETGPHAMVRQVARVIGIGIETADMLVHEVLSRPIRDRKAVARYAGLMGSPDERCEAAGTRPCQSRQCPGPPRHDPTRLALSAVSEAERTGTVVPGPHCR